MEISLIIPAYNEELNIESCIASVLLNSGGFLSELIIIDNASTDRTAEIAKRFSSVTVVYEPQKGLVKARECGRLNSSGDILAYIDADCRMPKGWCKRIIHEFATNPNLAAFSGPYYYYDIPTWKRKLVWGVWNVTSMPIYWSTGYMIFGGNFAIRRSVLEAMGGFDTSIDFYGEDANIARRAAGFGKVKFSPSFLIETSGRRFIQNGWFRTMKEYAFNYLSEAIYRRPVTMTHKDYR